MLCEPSSLPSVSLSGTLLCRVESSCSKTSSHPNLRSCQGSTILQQVQYHANAYAKCDFCIQHLSEILQSVSRHFAAAASAHSRLCFLLMEMGSSRSWEIDILAYTQHFSLLYAFFPFRLILTPMHNVHSSVHVHYWFMFTICLHYILCIPSSITWTNWIIR